jgi:hypothetical protein
LIIEHPPHCPATPHLDLFFFAPAAFPPAELSDTFCALKDFPEEVFPDSGRRFDPLCPVCSFFPEVVPFFP